MRLPPPARTRPRLDFALSTINLVFLLLLFYLVTGSLVQPEEIDADAPLTRDLPLDRLPRPLLLVAASGLFLDGNPVAPATLIESARRAVAASPRSPFLNILAERSVSAAGLLDIVGDIQAQGIEIRLVTLHGANQAAPGPGGRDP